MRAIKLIFVVLLALAVLLGVAAFIFIRTFDPNSYRELLSTSVEDATGRKLAINGDLQFTVWPNIALSAADMELSNPPGFDDTPMLRAKSVEATIQLAPLLQRDVRIDGVVLHSPEVYLVERPGADPENNWADLQQRLGGAGPETDPADATTLDGAPTSVQLTSIVIDNGQFSYTSGTEEQKLSAVDADVEFVTDSVFDIAARGNWQAAGEQTSSPFEVQTELTSLDDILRLSSPSLTMRSLPAPLPSELSLTALDINWGESGGVVRELAGDLVLDGTPVTLAVPKIEISADLNRASAADTELEIANSQFVIDLEARALLDAPEVSGELQTSGADTQALLGAFDVSLPETIPATALGPMELALKFRALASGAFSVTDARMAMTELGLRGQGSADLTPKGNAIGEIELDTLDLRRLSTKLPELLSPDTFLNPSLSKSPSAAPPQLDRLSSKFSWQPESGQKPARITFSDTSFTALGVSGTTSGETAGDVTSASVRFDKFALKQLLSYLIEPIATTNSAALSTAQGSATIRQTSGGTRLDDLNIRLDQSNIRGWLNNKEGDVPTLDFDLAIDQLDATGYLPPDDEADTSDSNLREVDANQALLGEMTLPTEVLRAYNLNGKLAIDSLQLFDLAMAGASLGLQLGDGSATLNNMSAQLYGGSFAGDFSFAQKNSSQQPVLAIKGDLQNIALDQLLLALADTASFAGIGSVQLDLSGSGSNVLEATQNSSGSMVLAMTNGSFTGVNLGHSLCKLYNQLRSEPAPPDNPDKSTKFESFSATANVVGGEATTNDLALNNNYLTLTGTGRARLARQSIAYDLDVELTGPIDEPNCETLTPYIGSRIPVKLSGTFANPTVRPDFGKLAKREIRRRVEEKLTEKLFDIFGKKREPEGDTETEPTP